MKRILFSALAAMTLATPAFAQNIGGLYAADGTNLDGSPYQGEAEITLLSETTCEIVWTIAGDTSQGVCMRYGPAFAASYSMGSVVGLVIYQVLDDGTLDGTWTIAGQNGAGTEVLTPVN